MLALALMLELCSLGWAGDAGVPVSTPSASVSASTSAPANPLEEASADKLASSISSESSPEKRVQLLKTMNAPALRGSVSFRTAARLMFSDLSLDVRRTAASAVMSYPGEESVMLIDKFMAQEVGAEARRDLALELSTAPAQRPSPEATRILCRLLAEDPELEVRKAALQGIAMRGDRRALEALQRAAAAEKDSKLRSDAKEVLKKLSVPPKVAPPKPKNRIEVKPDAVKGVDFCGDGNGWCECSLGPLHPRPRCIPRDQCMMLYQNSYMRQGYTCTFDGGSLD